jgi:threonine synthase
MLTHFQCIRCGNVIQSGVYFRCKCGGLYEVVYNNEPIKKNLFDRRIVSSEAPYNSGVWRFKELINPDIDVREIISRPEGNTNVYRRRSISQYTGIDRLSLKHEGENPTGSFKDRGMTVAVSEAVKLQATAVACASTGNTSASMAAYAAQAGLEGIVFIPEGEIAYGKLSQAIAFGARVIQVKGNFDDAMKLVEEASQKLGLYLLNF